MKKLFTTIWFLVFAFPIFGNKTYAAMIHYFNTTDIDFRIVPLDIRVAADQQQGSTGVMWFDEVFTTLQGQQVRWQGLETIGNDIADWSIGSYVTRAFRNGELNYEKQRTAFDLEQIESWQDKSAMILSGRESWLSYGFAFLAVPEQDGMHYGAIVTDFTRGPDKVHSWFYETTPEVMFARPTALPEPSTITLIILTIVVVLGYATIVERTYR